jgi:hypothetical protein
MSTESMSSAPALFATLGIGITVLGVLLGAIIKATRAWSRLEYDLRAVIQDFNTHISTERAERVEIVTKHAAEMESLANRVTLVERELVRAGGMGGHAGST